jgi:hypothetical protein
MYMFTSFGRQVGIGLVVGIVWWGLASGAEAALLAYWNFDEPSGVTAGSAASILPPGQLQGGVVHTTAGRFGRALQFDGTDDQVLVGNVVNLFSTLSDKITISFWAYGDDSLPRNSTVFGGKNAAGNRVLNAHLPWSNGRVYWDAGNSGSAYDRIDKAATTSAIRGQWNHWAFTKDATAGVMKIYLNGQLWQITAPSGTSSAALNKPATQSSTYSVAEASRAVDGNTDGNYWNGSVTHTNSEYQPWWRVDLASEIPIHDIVLFNRSDCCWDRLSNFHVSIFDAGMNEVFRRDLFTTEINPSSDRIPIHVGGVTGRYIQVQLNNTGSARPLSLAEVVVNGTPQTPQTYTMTGITSFAIGSEIGTVFWPG